MEELIINCRTGVKTRRKFTKEEETARLAEIALAREREKREARGRAKAQLLGALSDLKHAEEMEVENVLTAEDVRERRERVEALKAELVRFGT